MPLFARRRLQAMLNDIATLHRQKAVDLRARLENKRLEQAFPAELELGLLWAMSRSGGVEIEPERFGGARPEAWSQLLVPGREAIIEVTAPNDNGISGEAAMDRVALEMCRFANGQRRGLGDHLYFRFQTESGYEDGVPYRRRLVPENYQISPAACAAIASWIAGGQHETARLRIEEAGLNVELEWTSRRQIRFHNTWSSMPPEAYGVETNPLWDSLVRKLDQLNAPDRQILRFIFLADAGSTLLNRLGSVGEIDPMRRRTSGREIILHFVSKFASRIDAVVVFAPNRTLSWPGRDELRWSVSCFFRPNLELPTSGIEAIAAALPKPRFEGYQVRSLFRQGQKKQGLFAPDERGWYVGMKVTTGPDKIQMRVSSRALIELLAGRITPEMFADAAGFQAGGPNLFHHWLSRGKTLSEIALEPCGMDEDDDYVLLTFSDDPAARALELPPAGRPQAK